MVMVLADFFRLAMANSPDIGQAENCPLHGRRIRERPCSAAIVEVAKSALVLEARSPPPRIPCRGSRKATETPPALGELSSGVSDAFQVSPPSAVARILAIVEPPV